MKHINIHKFPPISKEKMQIFDFFKLIFDIFCILNGFCFGSMANAVATDCHRNYPKFLRFVSLQDFFHFPSANHFRKYFVTIVGGDWEQYCNCRCLPPRCRYWRYQTEHSSVLLLVVTRVYPAFAPPHKKLLDAMFSFIKRQ